jgi:hypothetical protein
MRARSNLVRDLVLPLIVGWVGACFAQGAPPNCALTDRACIDENYPRMCARDAMPESCIAWLREFERSPNPDVRASIAAMYGLMAGYWGANNPDPDLHDRAAKLIHGVLEEDPSNVGGLLGLASIAPTREERLSAMRRVVELDPSPMHLEFLASALAQDRGNLAESAALLERAYEAAMQRAPGPYAWRFARDAVFEYEAAELPSRATQLRERFERDLGLDAKLAEIAHAEAVDPARLNGVLGDLCSELIVRMLGASRCLAGIAHIVDAADRAAASGKARLAKSASDAMFLAARTGDVLSRADPAWRGRFESTLRRYFGAESAARMHKALTIATVE